MVSLAATASIVSRHTWRLDHKFAVDEYNLLMCSSYIILFSIGLKVFYRNVHLNLFTEKRFMTQESEVTF